MYKRQLQDINVRETLAVAPLIAMIFILGLFPNLLLSRMGSGVEVVLERYIDGRRAFAAMEDGAPAQLLARRGGPLERGYPKAPEAKASATKTAMNTGAAE